METHSELVLFNKAYDTIIAVIASGEIATEFKESSNWLKFMFEYNLRFGKKSRGLAVVETYQLIAQQYNNTIIEEDLHLTRILGWTVEILQASFLMLDDIMDQSITRRGQVCWYRKENIGLYSINDALIVQQAIYQILKKFFSTKKCYQNLIDMFHQVSLLTGYGQCLDLSSIDYNSIPKFEVFTQQRYNSIIKYKTAYYSYVLPVRLAIYFSSCYSKEEHRIAENILLKIGQLFQIQDDYIDCFGDPKHIGKIGTDIEDGKCCWIIITASKYCSLQQLIVLKANYGIRNAKCVKTVKEIYNELHLQEIYKIEETLINDYILCELNLYKLKTTLNLEIFRKMLNKIYRRNK